MRASEFITEKVNYDMAEKGWHQEKVIDVPGIGKVTLKAYNISHILPPQFAVSVFDQDGKDIGYFRYLMMDYEKPKTGWFAKKPTKDPYVFAGNASVWSEYQKKGLARQVYKWIKELGNDIRPSTTQTAAGKAMWGSFEKNPLEEEPEVDEGVVDWAKRGATAAAIAAGTMGSGHATGPEWTERPDGSIVKTIKHAGDTIKDKLTPSFMKKDSTPKAEPGMSLLSRNNPEAEEVLHTTALKAGLRGVELAQFLAQTRHESADFAHMKEIGSKQRFAKYETPQKAKQLGNKYRGDGERFKGRGFIQLTGRDNYTRASEQIFGDDRLVKNPDLASRFDVASHIALWYWKNQVRPYVKNFSDTKAVTKAINPAMHGLENRHNNFKEYMSIL